MGDVCDQDEGGAGEKPGVELPMLTKPPGGHGDAVNGLQIEGQVHGEGAEVPQQPHMQGVCKHRAKPGQQQQP